MAEAQTIQPEILPTEILPNYQPKTLAAIKMVNADIDPYEALQIVNNRSNISRAAVCKLRKKVNKFSLTHPKILKAANHQAQRILSGDPREIKCKKVTRDGEVIEYDDKIYPTDTNITAVLSEVYSRFEPVRTISTNLNLSVECSPVDLDRWQNRDKQIETGSSNPVSICNNKAIDV